MATELFANNATTTLGSAIGPSETTITVATGSGDDFPVLSGGDWFTATMWAAGSTTGTPNEIVKVTARTGDTMTVVRAQQGTSATSWSIGDTFANYTTADFLNSLVSDAIVQAQAGNYAVDSGTANAAVASLDPAVAALTDIVGTPVRIMKSANANTGAMTLNLNSLGIKSVVLNGVALVAGQLPASQIFEVIYDGTSFELISTPAVIPNAMLASAASLTLKGNLTGGAAVPADNTIAAVLTALGFAGQSLAGAGYYYFPNGLIIQWGTGVQSGGTGQTAVTFPIEFPTAGLIAFATPAGGPTVPTAFCGTPAPSTTGMTVWSASASGVPAGSGVGFSYLVLGH